MDQNELQRKIVITNDGSASIYIPKLNEHYHSYHGAIQEAQHVFIENGLKYMALDHVNVLEVGFGTGLNCLLTAKEDKSVFYHGVEAYPIEQELIDDLNYSQIVNDEVLFRSIHSAQWGEPTQVTPKFELLKEHCLIQELNVSRMYDLIYFDAFGPRAQADMWNPVLFDKLYKKLASNGALVTYCAKGQVRRDLQGVGFEVERLPGPPGKREMLRGVKRC